MLKQNELQTMRQSSRMRGETRTARDTPVSISRLLPQVGSFDEEETSKPVAQQTAWMLENDPAAGHAVLNHLHASGFSTQSFENINQMTYALKYPPESSKGYVLFILSIDELGEELYPFIHAVKALPATPNIPILLLSSSASSNRLEWALDLGADDFVRKPIQELELRTRLKKMRQLYEVKSSLHSNASGIRKDLEAASELQRSLLPTSPIKKPHIEFCWSYRPHGYVAGDMLNVFTLANNLYGSYVADVCGHGPAAAMMSIWLSHTLYPPKQSSQTELMQTSEALNAVLLNPPYTCAFLESKLADMNHELYFTMIYAIFDAEQRRIIYSRCGHPYPIVLKKSGHCAAIEDPGGPAIGMELGIPFTENVIQCAQGDRVFLYSDGLLEATAPNGDFFGTERLVYHLQQTRCYSLQDQVSSITKAISDFQGNQRFDDDVTVLGVELK